MDGMYPDDLNKKSGPAAQESTPRPGFAPERPPEDAELYLPPSKRAKPRWRKYVAKALKITIVVVLVAVIAAGVYLAFFHNKQTHQSGRNTAATTQPADPYTAKTQSYTSTNVGLTFAYPQTWKVSDSPGDLTLTSPATQLTDTNGKSFEGQLVLSVQPKGTTPKAFAAGGAISALNSQQVTYTKPTSVQRAQTYVSFLQYTQSLVQNQLDGMYVTGDFGYQANQYVPASDLAPLDPLITITFTKCSTAACTDPAPTSINSSMWADNANFQKTILGILASIQVSG